MKTTDFYNEDERKQAKEADAKYGIGKWHWADLCGGDMGDCKGNHIHSAECGGRCCE